MTKRLKRFLQLQLLLIGIFMVLALPGQANAFLLCRSDPVVILSNGAVLDIGASISTLPMQVQEVHYELHVPAGLTMVAAIHTPAWLTSQETFTFYADQAPGHYQVTTSARTSVGSASVSADGVLVYLFKVKLGTYTATGKEGQLLTYSFNA